MSARPTVFSLSFLFLVGCASTGTSATARARHRRHAAHSTSANSVRSDASATPPNASNGYETGLMLPSASAPSRDATHNARSDTGATRYSIGTPVAASEHQGDLDPRWAPENNRAHIRCEGSPPAAVPSTQSPYEPGNAVIVRSFVPIERRVLACRPPVNANGRFPVRGEFTSNGAPREFSFPEVNLSQDQALCVGRALCDVRMPAFRAVSSTVTYDYLVRASEGS